MKTILHHKKNIISVLRDILGLDDGGYGSEPTYIYREKERLHNALMVYGLID